MLPIRSLKSLMMRKLHYGDEHLFEVQEGVVEFDTGSVESYMRKDVYDVLHLMVRPRLSPHPYQLYLSLIFSVSLNHYAVFFDPSLDIMSILRHIASPIRGKK